MKRFVNFCAVFLLILAVYVPSRALAQQNLGLNPQGQPSIRYSPGTHPTIKPPSHQEETIPSVATPMPTATPTYQSGVKPKPPPVLPAVFRGCWQGQVSRLDSIQRLPGSAPIGPWAAKTYQLCYRRVGNGPFHLTFTDTGVAPNSKIINTKGHLELLSTDGRNYASMRAYLHFDEYRNGLHFLSQTFPVSEVTNLECEIKADGMHVWGSVVGQRDGVPWFRARWHTVFTRRDAAQRH
ncbi:MAG: hypothetical protein ACREQ4_18330 [Candidatus Binataceae bacterium]